MHRKVISNLTPRGYLLRVTYFNMTVGDVKRWLRTNKLMKEELRNLLSNRVSNSINIYRGYLGILYIKYNWKKKRLYVIRDWH